MTIENYIYSVVHQWLITEQFKCGIKKFVKKKVEQNQLIIWTNKTTFKLIFPIQSTYI